MKNLFHIGDTVKEAYINDKLVIQNIYNSIHPFTSKPSYTYVVVLKGERYKYSYDAHVFEARFSYTRMVLNEKTIKTFR